MEKSQSELKSSILELRLHGLTYRAIAVELGCDQTAINKVLREAGLAKARRVRSRADGLQIMELLKEGFRVAEITALTGWSRQTINLIRWDNGGVVPKGSVISPYRLSLADREEISRLLTLDKSFEDIATQIAKHRSSVWREVDHNGGRRLYRAWAAQVRSEQLRRRPRRAKLVRCLDLKEIVQEKLNEKWSPEQISNWLRYEEFPDDQEMWVSPETIYQSLFIQGRGALRRELTACLRTGRAIRKPRGRATKGGTIPDKVMISERPAEVEDRAVPGHWEGDLIVGADNKSAIGTLVERQTRYVMLMALEGKGASDLRVALGKAVKRLPEELFKTLTWDQGTEMAEHMHFKVDNEVDVYFCEPHSPWQRGTNENTNGLLRQYFPKSTDLSVYSQEELDAVADELNGRPRKTLSWKTPAQKLADLVALTG